MAEAVERYVTLRIRPRYKRVNSAEVYCRAVSMAPGRLAIDAVRPLDVSRTIADYRRTAPVASERHGADDDRWTPHDLRRSFASRCGDPGIAPHVIACERLQSKLR